LKFFHFWILNDFFNFYIGGHFENFKNKGHTFEWWSIFGVKFQKDQKHPHLVERDKLNKSESIGQILPQLPWKQKKRGFKIFLDSFHQT
jgi:hypothetical protein